MAKKNRLLTETQLELDYILKNKHLSYLNLNWKEIQQISAMTTPLDERTDRPDIDLVKLIRNPEYFHFTCKYILNKDILQIQSVLLQELWSHPFPMLIGSRGSSKSFSLAIYCILFGLIHQGCKIAITGAVFRQSKVVFSYIENIWNNAPVLRDMLGGENKNGASKQNDRWEFTLGETLITAWPIGTGDKIRGQRARLTIVDEFASLNPEIYETVIQGFTSVSSSPVDNVKTLAEIETLKGLGLWGEQQEENFSKQRQSNQSIIAGTAYYAFNHFYTYFKRYKGIVESKGDINRLEEVFNGEIPQGFNWKDYCVIRLPIELVPKGFMDDKQIARSKATLHSGIYTMEFSACALPNTEIITLDGIKQIKDIKVGDFVFTHKGRFRKVTEVFTRNYNGKIVKIKSCGSNQYLEFTPEHPFWRGENNWLSIDDIDDNFYLSNLNEVNRKQFIKLEDYCENYIKTIVDGVEYLYAKPSSVKNVVDRHIKYKGCIPNIIKLDYNFGLVLGYYASEGSCGSKGKFIQFSLDGHVDIRLEYYISELSDAILNVFGREPKYYNKTENLTNVCFSNRLVVELIKKICPGLSHNKMVDPNILFSNPELMRGFIVGYWHGDGCLQYKTKYATASSVSQSLLLQTKICLSYFGLSCGLYISRSKSVRQFKNRKYNTQQIYRIDINGENFYRLVDLINNELKPRYIFGNSKKRIDNDGDKSRYSIQSIDNYEYNGLVYNLEVEEDHSYSTICSAVHNCFTVDSHGFFKRTTIEACVANDKNQIEKIGGIVKFRAAVRGVQTGRYVYGVDPASEKDNFSIVVVELHQDHTRIVYCWTCTRERHRQGYKNGLTTEEDFYGFCSRKIRELMKAFPCEHIAIDSQGGGVAVMEALHDSKNLQPGELPIWPITADHPFSDHKEREIDGEPGLHIVEIVNFSSAQYVSEANHGMRKDLEFKDLLFPLFDPLEIAFAAESDNREGRIYDTLEDCVMEIEELKDELATIEHTQTATSGRDRWDTPEIKKSGNLKGRMRKDRYSALLMANMAARRMSRIINIPTYQSIGGFVGQLPKPTSTQLYTGPAWFTQALSSSSYGQGLNRTKTET